MSKWDSTFARDKYGVNVVATIGSRRQTDYATQGNFLPKLKWRFSGAVIILPDRRHLLPLKYIAQRQSFRIAPENGTTLAACLELAQ